MKNSIVRSRIKSESRKPLLRSVEQATELNTQSDKLLKYKSNARQDYNFNTYDRRGRTKGKPMMASNDTMNAPHKSNKSSTKNSLIEAQKQSKARHFPCTVTHNTNGRRRRVKNVVQSSLPKLETSPEPTPRYTKVDQLFGMLYQLSDTKLAHSPYFGCLSEIFNTQDLTRIKGAKVLYERECKRQKKSKSEKLPTLENRVLKRPTSAKFHKAIQTNDNCCPRLTKATSLANKSDGFTHISPKNKISSSNIISHQLPSALANAKVIPRSNCKKLLDPQSRSLTTTKLPPVLSNGGILKRARYSNAPRKTDSTRTGRGDCTIPKGNGTSLLYQQTHKSRYWTNEIKNYYDWTSFCMMRKHRRDTKNLKEQLEHLEQEYESSEPSVCDIAWKEADTFRKVMEKKKKAFNSTLRNKKMQQKGSTDGAQKKWGTKEATTKLNKVSNGQIPKNVKRSTKTRNLVPPPSAPDSLFSLNLLVSPTTSSAAARVRRNPQTVDSSTLANDSLRSTSDDNIFTKYDRDCRRSFVDLRLPYTNSSSEIRDSHSPHCLDTISKLKSKFTIRNERLSFNHLNRIR